jgi:hypothetical protein
MCGKQLLDNKIQTDLSCESVKVLDLILSVCANSEKGTLLIFQFHQNAEIKGS